MANGLLTTMKAALLGALLFAPTVLAQEVQPPLDSPTTSNRLTLFQGLVEGDLSEGERRLRESLEARPRLSPVELRLGYELGYAACRASEQKVRVRALLLADRAFAALETYLARAELAAAQRAQALGVKAYIAEMVLRDRETAHAFAQEALRWDPENAGALAVLERVQGLGLEGRLFAANTPYLNAAYNIAPKDLTLWPSVDSRGGRVFIIRGEMGSRYRLDTSTDLETWTEVRQGVLESETVTLPIDGGTDPQRFYRFRLLEEAANR